MFLKSNYGYPCNKSNDNMVLTIMVSTLRNIGDPTPETKKCSYKTAHEGTVPAKKTPAVLEAPGLGSNRLSKAARAASFLEVVLAKVWELRVGNHTKRLEDMDEIEKQKVDRGEKGNAPSRGNNPFDSALLGNRPGRKE